jgi:cytochrome c biogenesis protein CcmG/thiol:disulfide interchange protein DsbE
MMSKSRVVTRIVSILALGSAFAFAAGCGGGGGSSGGATQPDGEASGSSGSGGTPASTGGAAEIQGAYVTGDGPKSLAEAKGKVVIVDFWATYCQPCKKSFPKYQELVEQFGGELAVIAVSVDEPGDVDEAKLKEFASATKVKFPIVWDKEHKTAEAYKPPKMPTSFIIDKEGNVAHQHAGYESGEEEKIAEEVKKLLGK